jgi:hypothetical protein
MFSKVYERAGNIQQVTKSGRSLPTILKRTIFRIGMKIDVREERFPKGVEMSYK